MRAQSFIFLCGALTFSAPCFAAPDMPVSPALGSSDSRFLKLEKEHPGFGGMFLDENGTLNVYTLHPEVGTAAVETDLRRSELLATSEAAAPLNVLQGQYSFSTLAGWRDRLLPVLAIEGIVFLDIDETRNRLLIGVSDSAAISIVKNKAIAAKVPQTAIIIERADPIHKSSTVNDAVRPAIGAVQIQSTKGNCTLGFNALLDGIVGFVTNSHCTDRPGEQDNTAFLQPYSAENAIGSEFKDPTFFTEIPCPPVYHQAVAIAIASSSTTITRMISRSVL